MTATGTGPHAQTSFASWLFRLFVAAWVMSPVALAVHATSTMHWPGWLIVLTAMVAGVLCVMVAVVVATVMEAPEPGARTGAGDRADDGDHPGWP